MDILSRKKNGCKMESVLNSWKYYVMKRGKVAKQTDFKIIFRVMKIYIYIHINHIKEKHIFSRKLSF